MGLRGRGGGDLAWEVERLEREVEALEKAMAVPGLPPGAVRVLKHMRDEKLARARRLRARLEESRERSVNFTVDVGDDW